MGGGGEGPVGGGGGAKYTHTEHRFPLRICFQYVWQSCFTSTFSKGP